MLARALVLLVWLVLAWPAGSWAQGLTAGTKDRAVRLDDRAGTIDPWPVVTVLPDPEGKAAVQEMLTRLHEFSPPASPLSNLGPRTGAVWLRIPVDVPPTESGRWIFDIDYPSLDRVDLYVVSDGLAVQQLRLGDTVPFAERPMRTRSHAAPLVLERGMRHDLLLRVETTSSMVLPISLTQPEPFQAREAQTEMLQGLLAGIGLCLFVYTLAQWVSLRDPMFLYYALTMAGVTPFSLAYFGVGPQHLWGDSAWLTQNAAPLTVLIGLVGGFLFVPRALDIAALSRRTAQLMHVLAGVTTIITLLFVTGVLGYRTTQALATLLGPLPMLLMIPTAFARWRRGDRAAGYMLLGWCIYLCGVIVMALLLRGFVDATFWTQHAFQFSLTIEMMVWMLVLGVRIDEMRISAMAAQRERDQLQSLAHTDALTSLLNRRGLEVAVEPLLRGPGGTARTLALYVLDLDGFKPVNDTHGHDVGDELLRQVGQRLLAHLRSSDRVARLGGDEFVVAVADMIGEAEAQHIGSKLLHALEEPFLVGEHRCSVGVTVGYALAPHDGRDLQSLLKRADAAMYAGKQAGKHCVRRVSAASVGLVSG